MVCGSVDVPGPTSSVNGAEKWPEDCGFSNVPTQLQRTDRELGLSLERNSQINLFAEKQSALTANTCQRMCEFVHECGQFLGNVPSLISLAQRNDFISRRVCSYMYTIHTHKGMT